MRRREPVFDRHGEVEDHHIRPELQGLRDSFLAVTGLDDLPVIDTLEKLPECLPERVVVVCNQDSSWHSASTEWPAAMESYTFLNV